MRTRRQNIQLELALEPVAKGEARNPDTQGTEARTAHAEPERPAAACRLTPSNRRVRTRTHGGVGGEEPRGSPLSRLRYGPAGDSAPRLRLKATGMTERFLSGPSTRPEPPLFPREQRVSPDRPAAVQGAKRRSVPLTARTDLELFETRGKGVQERGGRAGRGSPSRGLRTRPWRHSVSPQVRDQR